MMEPARNDTSTIEEKLRYVQYLIEQACETADAKFTWTMVDFMKDSMLVEDPLSRMK